MTLMLAAKTALWIQREVMVPTRSARMSCNTNAALAVTRPPPYSCCGVPVSVLYVLTVFDDTRT